MLGLGGAARLRARSRRSLGGGEEEEGQAQLHFLGGALVVVLLALAARRGGGGEGRGSCGVPLLPFSSAVASFATTLLILIKVCALVNTPALSS